MVEAALKNKIKSYKKKAAGSYRGLSSTSYLDFCRIVVLPCLVLCRGLVAISQEALDAILALQAPDDLVHGAVFDGVLMDGKGRPAQCWQHGGVGVLITVILKTLCLLGGCFHSAFCFGLEALAAWRHLCYGNSYIKSITHFLGTVSLFLFRSVGIMEASVFW